MHSFNSIIFYYFELMQPVHSLFSSLHLFGDLVSCKEAMQYLLTACEYVFQITEFFFNGRGLAFSDLKGSRAFINRKITVT